MEKITKTWYSKVKNRLHLDEKCSKSKAEIIIREENIPKHTFLPYNDFNIIRVYFQSKTLKLGQYFV